MLHKVLMFLVVIINLKASIGHRDMKYSHNTVFIEFIIPSSWHETKVIVHDNL